MDRSLAIGRLQDSGVPSAIFDALTATGGRLVGSRSEAEACALLRDQMRRVYRARHDEHVFEYSAWESSECSLQIVGGPALRCHPLIWSAQADGLEAEIVDLGRGTEGDFREAGSRLAGRIALVEHEYPFSSQTIHRRLKYGWSLQHGAAGFVIANNLPGNCLVTGSCGQDSEVNIPGLGVSLETGELLRARRGTRARIRHSSARRAQAGRNLIAEVPGTGPEWVVICAHYDGHDLAQSALDNATGVAAAIAVLEAFSDFVPVLPRGLRLILFTAEESGLLGSQRYVESLSEPERRSIALVMNLDTLTGSPHMACLTSGFEALEAFVRESAEEIGLGIPCIPPLLRNSDHFNFARHGIPAMRLVAGFDHPEAGARFLLTEADTRDKVSAAELKLGTLIAGHLAWSALTWPQRIAPQP